MEITALSEAQRQALATATQPVFEEHIKTNLDQKANELLGRFKAAVEQANNSQYLQ